MALDRVLLAEVLELTRVDEGTARTTVDEIRLEQSFLANFVAESEALEGYESVASEVLDSVRDLVLA